MRNYLEEYQRNIKLTNLLLKPLNQEIWKPVNVSSVFGLIRHFWPIWYITAWVMFYTYMIFNERAGLAIISEQIWCLMSILQTLTKLVNGYLQNGKIRVLMKWCEENYTIKHKPEYQVIVDNVFEKTNIYIAMSIRVNAVLVGSAVLFYLGKPLQIGNRSLPTAVSVDGVEYFSFPVFVALYLGQILHGICVFLVLSGYDAIFIQCIMMMKYRFKTMTNLLELLKDCRDIGPMAQKDILVDICKLHLNVLDATELFRSYYFFYGLVQLGNNLLCNCSILYILQTIGYDISSISVLITSSTQVFIACAFGQQLQDEARIFEDALYEIDWINLSLANKKTLLIMMAGSQRIVNIRAGGTYELNLALFAQIMKAGATLCAVMQAM